VSKFIGTPIEVQRSAKEDAVPPLPPPAAYHRPEVVELPKSAAAIPGGPQGSAEVKPARNPVPSEQRYGVVVGLFHLDKAEHALARARALGPAQKQRTGQLWTVIAGCGNTRQAAEVLPKRIEATAKSLDVLLSPAFLRSPHHFRGYLAVTAMLERRAMAQSQHQSRLTIILVNVVCSEIPSEIRRRRRCKHNGYHPSICCSENTCFPNTSRERSSANSGGWFRTGPASFRIVATSCRIDEPYRRTSVMMT
jgi:hypothetical protein